MHWSEGAQTDVLWQLTENVQEKQRWYNLTDDVICKDVRLLPNTSAVIVVTPSVADEQLPNADIAVGDSTVAALERSPRTYQLQLECPACMLKLCAFVMLPGLFQHQTHALHISS